MSEPTGRIAALVLAAGSSSRLGRNKLLLELEGETLVRRAARRAVEAGLSPVLVVVGFESARVTAALEGLPVEPVPNPRHEEGTPSSVRAGLARIPADCVAAVVILPDMPLVTAAMLARVAARFREGTAPLVISLYDEVQAPPTLYGRSLFPALARMGPGGGREIVSRHRHLAITLRWPGGLLVDLDRAEDAFSLGIRWATGLLNERPPTH
jgi:molybdenum cofactor cytidylyltransferase